jgi:DNA-binding NarL/FixJ family response regulator
VSSSTVVVFLCCNCAAAYKAVQKLTESKQVGSFECSQCNSLVHSWREVYDYSAWCLIAVKKPKRGPRSSKRPNMIQPRRASKPWTQQEEQQLIEMAKTEMTAREIARTLKRSAGSIYSRLQSLYRKQRI